MMVTMKEAIFVEVTVVVVVETMIVCAVMVDNYSQIRVTVRTVLVKDTQAVPVVVEVWGEVAEGF